LLNRRDISRQHIAECAGLDHDCGAAQPNVFDNRNAALRFFCNEETSQWFIPLFTQYLIRAFRHSREIA